MQNYDRTGQQMGNYRLTRLLGQGGFADVYLAEHTHLGTEAAIKILATRLLGDELERFRDEARTIARLKHPHIIRILDFGIEGTTPFLVMEYAVGGTLRQRHPRGSRIPLSVVVSYVKQVADALQYAHDRKLIHRDIKPENMLLGDSNEVLLSDFGIAIISQSSRSAQTQDTTGTIAYMAPEQIQAHPRPASDQYALGIVTYEWLTGAPPFQGSFIELAAKHLLTPPAPLRQHAPTISPMVEQVVMTALTKEPKERFGSVQAFANALEQASQGAAVSTPSPRPSASPPLPPPVAPTELKTPAAQVSTPINTDAYTSFSHSSQPVMSSEVPVSGLGASTGPSTTSFKEVKQEKPAVQQKEVSTSSNYPPQAARRSSQLAPPPSSRSTEVAPERSGRISRRAVLIGLAGVAVVGGGGIVWYVRAHQTENSSSAISAGSLLYTYTGHSAIVKSVAWSSNDARIASASVDKTVQIWNAADGTNPYTYKGHADSVNSVAWSLDGTRLASASTDKTVQIWNAADGTNSYTYTRHQSGVNAAAWSHDGKRIASASQDYTVQVWSASNGTSRFTYQGHEGSVNAVTWSPDGKRIASAGGDQMVQVWNASNGANPYIYNGHSSTVNAVVWSPDGTLIVSASVDSTVQVWNAADGTNTFNYTGHSGSVYAVAWSPDGKRIASAGADNTVQVWNAMDGVNPYVYKGHSDAVFGVAWSPDGIHIASASADKTVQVWQAV